MIGADEVGDGGLGNGEPGASLSFGAHQQGQLTTSGVAHHHGARNVNARNQRKVTPRPQHIGEGVHPHAIFLGRPPLVFDVPCGNTGFCKVLGDGLHQVEGVLLFPKTAVDEHDARDAFVLLKR